MSQWAGNLGFLGVCNVLDTPFHGIGGYSSPLQSLNDLVSRLDVLLRYVLVSMIDGPGTVVCSIYVVDSIL